MTGALPWRRIASLAALALLACLTAAHGARAQVYFSAFLPGGSGLQRAGFSGAGLQTLQFQPSGFADGIALDVTAGRMYWTDTDASVIWSAAMSGEGAQIVLDDFGAEPLGIALDTAGAKMYWTDSAGIKRANLDGSRPEVLVKGAARGFIALDPAAQRMYWADWPTGTVKSAAMAPEAPVATVAAKQACPFGVAVDHAHARLYWLELENTQQKKCEKSDTIRSANLDGSEAKTVLERPGAGFEGGLALDPSAGKLYWTEAQTRDIASANLDGSAAQALFSTREAVPVGLAVESADPRPANAGAPAIEGRAAVGSPLSCNAGTWRGTGPVALAYQWVLDGLAVEGAGTPTYVPSAEQTGHQLACVVTASDNIASSSASSPTATIAPFGGVLAAPPSAKASARLVAGFALTSLFARGASARVPVFTSVPARAILVARPVLPRRARSHRRAHGAGAAKRSRPSARSHRVSAITVRTALAPGRDVIVLRGLHPGVAYRLLLTVTAAEGQAVSETAILAVRRS